MLIADVIFVLILVYWLGCSKLRFVHDNGFLEMISLRVRVSQLFESSLCQQLPNDLRPIVCETFNESSGSRTDL